MPTATRKSTFVRSDLVVLGGGGAAVLLAGLTRFVGGGAVLAFVCAGVAVALLAALVGRAVDQLGDRFGPGATGILQSGLGNLPELFIGLFALKAGLIAVVQAAIIGSILANLLLVLGLCFLVGGLKHGPQQLDSERARSIIVLMVLSVAALVLPSLAAYVHTPAAGHEGTLSMIVSVILLVLFVLTLPASLKRKPAAGSVTSGTVTSGSVTSGSVTSGTVTSGTVTSGPAQRPEGAGAERVQPRWPLPLAVVMLVVAAALAAFVSDWFVHALEPAMASLGITEAFAGLVIVAIAGNAVENVVGIQLAAANRSEYAFSVVINSPLQISLVLAPLLVILAQVFGFATFTLVFPPMLIVAVVVAVILTAFITFDGESTWIEGAALIAVYAIIATSFWWG